MHRFKVGQNVFFSPRKEGKMQPDAPAGLYQIIKRLPAADDGEFRYEIRSSREEHNRMARESELSSS